MITRAQIVAEARSWIGTRWQHQASLKGIACDCIGLVAGVARELGIPAAAQFDATPTMRSYGRNPDPAALLAACDLLLDPVRDGPAREGDVLVMKFLAEPQHFGIVTEGPPIPHMVHALASARKVVEHRIDALWRTRIITAYRFRGIE